MLHWVQEALPSYVPPVGLMDASRSSYLAVCERERSRRGERQTFIPDWLALHSLQAFVTSVDLAFGTTSLDDAFMQMTTNTAAGYPFVGLKRDVVTAFTDPSFLSWMESVRVSPHAWPSTFTETVKEELRKFEDDGVALKDPHIIYGQDIVSLLIVKRRSMLLDESLYDLGRAGGSPFAPGMSMFYGSWDALAVYLSIGDEQYVYWCSDWRKFNESMAPTTFCWIQYFRELFENQHLTAQEAHCVWAQQYPEVANRYTGLVEAMYHILMSGGVRTCPDNTFHAIMLTIAALHEALRITGQPLSCVAIVQVYRFKTYGDNLILRLPRDQAHLGQLMGQIWNEWGYDYTGGIRPWQQADFLSHYFERNHVINAYIPVAVRWEKHLTSLCYPPLKITNDAWVGRFASLRVMLASNCDADEVIRSVYAKWCAAAVGYYPAVSVPELNRVMHLPRDVVLATFFMSSYETNGLAVTISPFNSQTFYNAEDDEYEALSFRCQEQEDHHFRRGDGGTQSPGRPRSRTCSGSQGDGFSRPCSALDALGSDPGAPAHNLN